MCVYGAALDGGCECRSEYAICVYASEAHPSSVASALDASVLASAIKRRCEYARRMRQDASRLVSTLDGSTLVCLHTDTEPLSRPR